MSPALWRDPGDRRVLTATLSEGQRIIARPLVPDDAEALLEGWRGLSSRSRLFRFLREAPPPTLDQARGLSQGDTGHDVALGAAKLVEGAEVPAAVARFYEIEKGTAEMALTVVDHIQSQGLGGLLLGLLADLAVDRGVRRFVGLVHVRNAGMGHILDALGASLGSRQGTALEFVLPLRRDPADYPATPTGDVFRHAHLLRRVGAQDV